MAIQNTGNARNILVGASPLFLSSEDITESTYVENAEPGYGVSTSSIKVPAFASGTSYTTTLNAAVDPTTDLSTTFYYRNVGFTNNGLQITYNPTFDSVTVDQLLDTAKLFKSAMEVMIATEMSEGTLENVQVVFGQKASTLTSTGTGVTATKTLGLEAGALGAAPTERQLIAVGQAPTASATATERVYYARRVLSVQQSAFSLARSSATTFPVTFRLLPSGSSSYVGSEYGKIIDRILTA
jgi:hypothetical protein